MEKATKTFGKRKHGPVRTSKRRRAKAAAPLDPAEIAASMPISYVWFSFDMRINRKVYWLKGILLLFLVQIAFPLVVAAIGVAVVAVLGLEAVITAVMAEPDSLPIGLYIFAGILYVPFFVFVMWASLAVAVKRCHDRDRSGWFLLIGGIPLIGVIWLFVELACLKGTSGENRFGPDPLTAGA